MKWWQRRKSVADRLSDEELKVLQILNRAAIGLPGVPLALRPRPPWWRRVGVPLALFLVTFCTVTINGALLEGVDIFAEPGRVWSGLPFAVALISILLIHEMGHYLTARHHGVPASLPYFLPAPPFFIGTFGAFIKMEAIPSTRAALFDVGAAGPWAGFFASVAAFVIGLQQSRIEPVTPDSMGLELGDSLLTKALVHWVMGPVPEGFAVYFSPVAFAGWVGFFVTVLNLLPMGQLDGGHIAYAFFGRRHALWARVAWGGVVVCALIFWPGWYFWAFFPLIFGFDHPPTRTDWNPLRGWRRWGFVMTVLLFVALFVPRPLAPLYGPEPSHRDQVPVERPREQPREFGLQEV
jgi:membrane-associated protease RseP (regulator of RpoE activity)